MPDNPKILGLLTERDGHRAAFAGDEPGDRAVLDGAKAMAMTMADLWLSPGALDQVTAAFQGGERGREPSAAGPG